MNREKVFHYTITLMYATAIFWILFASIWLFRQSDYRYFYFVSGIAYGIFISVLAFFLHKRRAWAWWLVIIFACANIILTFADQVGWFDLAYLIPAIGLLLLVIMSKPALQSISEESSKQH